MTDSKVGSAGHEGSDQPMVEVIVAPSPWLDRDGSDRERARTPGRFGLARGCPRPGKADISAPRQGGERTPFVTT